jgi:hypothetical protein
MRPAMPAPAEPFPGPTPAGRQSAIVATAPLPVEGSVDLDMPVERLWGLFLDVRRWPEWNRCFWRSHVRGGELRIGARLVLTFNPIRPWYVYKLPGTAEVVELEPHDRITWEASAPGFHVLHSYRFAGLDEQRCRFGSWEVAEGRVYRATQRFWLAHFRYVCHESLAGARALSERDRVSG